MASFPRPKLPSKTEGLTINPLRFLQGGRLHPGQPLYIPMDEYQRGLFGPLDVRRPLVMRRPHRKETH